MYKTCTKCTFLHVSGRLFAIIKNGSVAAFFAVQSRFLMERVTGLEPVAFCLGSFVKSCENGLFKEILIVLCTFYIQNSFFSY